MEGEVAKYGTVDQGNKVVQEEHHIEINVLKGMGRGSMT